MFTSRPCFALTIGFAFVLLCSAVAAQTPGAAAAPAAPAVDPPNAEQYAAMREAERRIIMVCTSDAYNALHIAAHYFEIASKSQDQTMELATRAGEPGRAIARDLFVEAAAGTVKSAPRFATMRLFKCLETNKFPMDPEIGAPQSDLCWARSEVINHSSVLKAQKK